MTDIDDENLVQHRFPTGATVLVDRDKICGCGKYLKGNNKNTCYRCEPNRPTDFKLEKKSTKK